MKKRLNRDYTECDFYRVEEQDGKKYIRLQAYVYFVGESADEETPDAVYRMISYGGAEYPIDEFIRSTVYGRKNVEATKEYDGFTQYIDDLTEEEVNEFFKKGYVQDEPFSELPFSAITLDTPCGNYVDYVDRKEYPYEERLTWQGNDELVTICGACKQKQSDEEILAIMYAYFAPTLEFKPYRRVAVTREVYRTPETNKTLVFKKEYFIDILENAAEFAR